MGLVVRFGPQALRMNLDTLLPHAVLHAVLHVAASLRDAVVSLGETDLRAGSDYADRIADESEIRRST